MENKIVSFHKFLEKTVYPEFPFNPPEIFPEFSSFDYMKINSGNKIYSAVRDLLVNFEFDKNNIGNENWNPFGDFVKEGQKILIKPNLVTHYHVKGKEGLLWSISNPSIIRVLIDYCIKAIGKSGKIIIGDTPVESCKFDELTETIGLKQLIKFYNESGYDNIELMDFRTYETTYYPNSNIETKELIGDPDGYTDIDLGNNSLFDELEKKKGPQNYYTLGDHTVNHENPRSKIEGLPNKYHKLNKHIYRIPNSVLTCDFVINVAKLKTHKFAGSTLLLKNIVGITQGKEFLPHRRPGTPEEGGDSFRDYPSAKYLFGIRMKKIFFKTLGNKLSLTAKKIYHLAIPEKLPHEKHSEPLWGDWHGNDTIWRSILDLNIILKYANKSGLNSVKQRNFLGIIDGVIGMDHEGPMQGLPVESNLIIASKQPVAGDILGSYLMGFNPMYIPVIANSRNIRKYEIDNINLNTDNISGNIPLNEAVSIFIPTKGWYDTLYNTFMDFKNFNK
ncbi:MAG: DUF362 domain-containing protein [Ignavibacteria bacterium]|nr:DUF362 domain-containing protein [Ignavibacteria bacterium]